MPTPVVRGSTSMVEQPDSGLFTLRERVLYQQRFRGPYATGSAFANLHYRGTTWTLTIPGIGSANFIVEDAECARERGGIGLVTVNYCYLGTPPPEEWALTPFEINPAIERNAFFEALTQADLKKAKMSFNAATAAGQTAVDTVIGTVANATLITSLINKWLKGQENYYLAGFKFQHTLYAFTNYTVNLGGYIEDPFGTFSGYIPGSLSWLRQADEESWNNGIWKLTRTWLGGPDGNWDSDLYS